MRLPVVLGMVLALIVGIVSIGAIVYSVGGQPIVVPTRSPLVTPAAISSLPASATPSAAPGTTSTPGPSGSPGGPVFSPIVGTEIGQRAPSFVLPHLGGGEISTADSAGRPMWINFMATTCPECRDELPMMMLMLYRLDQRLDMIVVDIGEDEETVSDFMLSVGADLPVALDLDAAVQRQWGVFVLPVHFFIDEHGIIREVVYGGAPREVFVDAVHTIVPDVDLSES